MEEKAWNQHTKQVLKKKIKSYKFHNLITTTQRTYYLYRARGPSYLFFARTITPYVLQRLLKEDFTLLYAEAQSLAQQEIEEVLGMTPLTGAR